MEQSCRVNGSSIAYHGTRRDGRQSITFPPGYCTGENPKLWERIVKSSSTYQYCRSFYTSKGMKQKVKVNYMISVA